MQIMETKRSKPVVDGGGGVRGLSACGGGIADHALHHLRSNHLRERKDNKVKLRKEHEVHVGIPPKTNVKYCNCHIIKVIADN